MIRYCDCLDWKPNIDYINSTIMMYSVHSYGADPYNLTLFQYCPWCGKKLKEKEENEQRA